MPCDLLKKYFRTLQDPNWNERANARTRPKEKIAARSAGNKTLNTGVRKLKKKHNDEQTNRANKEAR